MNEPPRNRTRLIVPVLLILVLLNLALMARLAWPLIYPDSPPVSTSAARPSAVQAAAAGSTATPPPESAPVFPTLPAYAHAQEGWIQQGVIVLSMRDGSYYHLVAYHPQFLPFTRLTSGEWDDISPAVSPDGQKIAFASHRGGYWDLYLLDLTSGKVAQVTDTPEYDGAPTWSPDGLWLAYESYRDDNLDIFLLALDDPSQPPTRLTDAPEVDHSPAWSPAGRQIAFVSARTGEEEIWLADLDNAESRFTNLSRAASSSESHPAWSPAGDKLAWDSVSRGVSSLLIWQPGQAPGSAQPAGAGRLPVWSPTGNAILAELAQPNQSGLVVYDLAAGIQALTYTVLPGSLQGAVWRGAEFAQAVTPALRASSPGIVPAHWQPTLTRYPIAPAGRYALVVLDGVQTNFPLLHDAADDAFKALRQETAARTGWDFLSSLEDAFIPITEPSSPGMEINWLYTGRAFAANTALASAGWLVIAREDLNGQTYWRVYLKARYQDGSQGMPLTTRTWNLDARNDGDPRVYEQGGMLVGVPSGYWIDFTDLARRFGWERLPALVNWITFYSAARYNQFVFSGGLAWDAAMAEVYPPEALITPTSAPTYTVTPSPAPGDATPEEP